MIYNRLQGRDPARDRRDDPLRDRQLDRAAQGSRSWRSSRRTTRARTRACRPGPIGNPGLDSIKAAANPADTDYLFFVVKPCGEGEHAFSETDAEFQEDVARYNAERAAQGGQSPTEC